MRVVKTAGRTPEMEAVSERFLGSVPRSASIMCSP
jgi:hypothetical protein